MRIHIVAVGRARQGPERSLFEHYAGRLKAWPLNLREVEPRGRVAPGRLKAAEAELILAALPDRATVVALDETGQSIASSDFARRIADWRTEGTADLVFVIGGADGLDESVRRRADMQLSFGRATWPHMLVRGLLAEQLYRSQQIIAGHPYHRQ